MKFKNCVVQQFLCQNKYHVQLMKNLVEKIWKWRRSKWPRKLSFLSEKFPIIFHIQEVFFDISIDGESVGRIRIGLFGLVVPKTCENIAQLAAQTEVVNFNVFLLISIFSAWTGLQKMFFPPHSEGFHGSGRRLHSWQWNRRVLNIWPNFSRWKF